MICLSCLYNDLFSKIHGLHCKTNIVFEVEWKRSRLFVSISLSPKAQQPFLQTPDSSYFWNKSEHAPFSEQSRSTDATILAFSSELKIKKERKRDEALEKVDLISLTVERREANAGWKRKRISPYLYLLFFTRFPWHCLEKAGYFTLDLFVDFEGTSLRNWRNSKLPLFLQMLFYMNTAA